MLKIIVLPVILLFGYFGLKVVLSKFLTDEALDSPPSISRYNLWVIIIALIALYIIYDIGPSASDEKLQSAYESGYDSGYNDGYSDGASGDELGSYTLDGFDASDY